MKQNEKFLTLLITVGQKNFIDFWYPENCHRTTCQREKCAKILIELEEWCNEDYGEGMG